jgi:hypothetical protein
MEIDLDLMQDVKMLNVVSCKHSLKFLAQLQKIVSKLPNTEVSPP